MLDLKEWSLKKRFVDSHFVAAENSRSQMLKSIHSGSRIPYQWQIRHVHPLLGARQKSTDPEPSKVFFTEGMDWKALGITPHELRLSTTLNSGQSFRWIETRQAEWTCALPDILISLRQTEIDIEYLVHSNPLSKDPIAVLDDYFRLSVNLEKLYLQWSLDANFKAKALTVIGLRLLNQDSVENIFSFICSSNNNISRIKSMVLNLCKHYGTHVGCVNDIDFYSFPNVDSLAADGVESRLRELGFGYRAKYIYKSALYLTSNPSFLPTLRDSLDVQESLMLLSGVGPKVADCIRLMSQGQLGTVPVDTHVLQIAQRDYGCSVKGSMTTANYDKVQGVFGKIFGELAGWAHTILFFADLKPSKVKVVKIKTRDESVNIIKAELIIKSSVATPTKRKSDSMKVTPTKSISDCENIYGTPPLSSISKRLK